MRKFLTVSSIVVHSLWIFLATIVILFPTFRFMFKETCFGVPVGQVFTDEVMVVALMSSAMCICFAFYKLSIIGILASIATFTTSMFLIPDKDTHILLGVAMGLGLFLKILPVMLEEASTVWFKLFIYLKGGILLFILLVYGFAIYTYFVEGQWLLIFIMSVTCVMLVLFLLTLFHDSEYLAEYQFIRDAREEYFSIRNARARDATDNGRHYGVVDVTDIQDKLDKAEEKHRHWRDNHEL